MCEMVMFFSGNERRFQASSKEKSNPTLFNNVWNVWRETVS